MSLSQFIKENRAAIDKHIAAVLRKPENPYPNDQERRIWVLNDESLYRWAKSEGVRI